MTTAPDTKVTRNGCTLTQRVWDLIADVSRVTGHTLVVIQGGFRDPDGAGPLPSAGATASVGAHDIGDVFDIERGTFTDAELTTIAVELRRRNVAFWWRLRRYGWTSTGEHGHGVVRDSVYGLSALARSQVVDYDRGLDGLAHATAAARPYKGKDYHPRPTQQHWPFPGRVVVYADLTSPLRWIRRTASVAIWQQALQAEKFMNDPASVTGRWNRATAIAHARAVAANGGSASSALTTLGRKHGFTWRSR